MQPSLKLMQTLDAVNQHLLKHFGKRDVVNLAKGTDAGVVVSSGNQSKQDF
jgi:hypothetical protein